MNLVLKRWDDVRWDDVHSGRRPQGAPMDGWNTVSRTPMDNVGQSVDPSKMKFYKQNPDENVIQLGRGVGQSRFGGWSQGSKDGTTDKLSEQKEKRQPNTPAKRAIGTSQSVGGSNRDRSGGGDLDNRNREEPNEKQETLLTKDQMERKTDRTVEEYLHISDIKKLEFTKGGDSIPTRSTTGLRLNDIDQKLRQLIVKEKVDNEVVFNWIDSNVDDPTTKRSQFIRILMTAVCNSAIKGEKGKERVEPRQISSRGDLQKYLDHQTESELQALYALQALVTKLEHPPGVLRQMFDTLYDEDIISEDAFLQWEKSDEEPKGKAVALRQIVQFFEWLREAEDDS